MTERKPYLTVEPFDAPGKYHGHPAYHYMGLQMCKSVVDSWDDAKLMHMIVRHEEYGVRPDRNVLMQVAVARMIDELPGL